MTREKYKKRRKKKKKNYLRSKCFRTRSLRKLEGKKRGVGGGGERKEGGGEGRKEKKNPKPQIKPALG